MKRWEPSLKTQDSYKNILLKCSGISRHLVKYPKEWEERYLKVYKYLKASNATKLNKHLKIIRKEV